MASPSEFKPTIVGFLCNWCCYGGADLAGVSRFQYPPYLRVIRLMCSGRVDLEFIFRAFAKKADAVFIGNGGEEVIHLFVFVNRIFQVHIGAVFRQDEVVAMDGTRHGGFFPAAHVELEERHLCGGVLHGHAVGGKENVIAAALVFLQR